MTDSKAVEYDAPKVCSLCGYSIMKHVVPAYGTWAETPTGLWCPTDARVSDDIRLPVLSEVPSVAN